MYKYNPLLIVVDGPEGGGKTLITKMMADTLRTKGYEVVLSREPGGVPVAEKIRDIVVNDYMHPITEAYLYLASRAEHIQKIIKPALYDGKIVILDRFMHSTLAYQGGGRGLDMNELRRLHRLALDDVSVDMAFFLDVPVEIGLARKQEDEIAKFEKEDISFHNNLYNTYQSFVAQGEMIRIDATKSPDNVLNDILLYIQNILE